MKITWKNKCNSEDRRECERWESPCIGIVDQPYKKRKHKNCSMCGGEKIGKKKFCSLCVLEMVKNGVCWHCGERYVSSRKMGINICNECWLKKKNIQDLVNIGLYLNDEWGRIHLFPVILKLEKRGIGYWQKCVIDLCKAVEGRKEGGE